ncbi:arsenate reductase [Aliidongia dinghuensis]|uniref:Arsenate reductase n=1 Tax=Aliidongia dinghuensis TaxID=1867774 RepID=A0A8J2YPI0_9PROT|nr:arsenate reductase ArsC [Aliidongia dinghuensis]GGF03122.1 arsenate reductase [Aliidongia dinghuensis]
MKPYNVLFLCTGNSARSILAEALIDQIGEGRFKSYSAGSSPRGEVHPMAIALLREEAIDPGRFRSKSWNEFAAPGAPTMDFIFTVCDRAAGEICPTWPGHPITAHWGVPDPAAVERSSAEQMQAFREAYWRLATHIRLFAELPIASLDRMAIKSQLDAIGRLRGNAEGGLAP